MQLRMYMQLVIWQASKKLMFCDCDYKFITITNGTVTCKYKQAQNSDHDGFYDGNNDHNNNSSYSAQIVIM